MTIMKNTIRQLLVGMAEIGRIGSPRDYPTLSSTPFSDDKARMRSDIRKVDREFSKAARRHLQAWQKNQQQVCEYHQSN